MKKKKLKSIIKALENEIILMDNQCMSEYSELWEKCETLADKNKVLTKNNYSLSARLQELFKKMTKEGCFEINQNKNNNDFTVVK